MLIVSPKVEMMLRPFSPKDRAYHVELCGRVCYKSEEKIGDGTAEKFILNLIKHGHEAMLEHSRVLIRIQEQRDKTAFTDIRSIMAAAAQFDYLAITVDTRGYLVSANMRAWRNFCKFALSNEIELPNPVKALIRDNPAFFPDVMIDATDYPSEERNPWFLRGNGNKIARTAHSWYSFRFTCDRGVSHELVRHRPASFAQESTRYCNYSTGRFGGQITVIEPSFFLPGTNPYEHWKTACQGAEIAYFALLNDGCSPQQARTVLPNSLKTEIVMTATATEWLHFLGLRVDKAAHPQMREVATQAAKMLVEVDPEIFAEPVKRIEAANEQ